MKIVIAARFSLCSRRDCVGRSRLSLDAGDSDAIDHRSFRVNVRVYITTGERKMNWSAVGAALTSGRNRGPDTGGTEALPTSGVDFFKIQ